MNTSISSRFFLFALIPILILPSGYVSWDLSLIKIKGERVHSRASTTLWVRAWMQRVQTYTYALPRAHAAIMPPIERSRWINMPVTDLIHPPTPKLYRDTIYLGTWVCARVWASICAPASLSGLKQPCSICSISMNSSIHLLLVSF